jgi:hypothetical protein
MTNKSYGRNGSGTPTTEELLEKLVERAEEGFDVDAVLRSGLAAWRWVRRQRQWSRRVSVLN